MKVKPGGNNYEIPNRVAFGCMGFMAFILLVNVVVIVRHVLSYPERNF